MICYCTCTRHLSVFLKTWFRCNRPSGLYLKTKFILSHFGKVVLSYWLFCIIMWIFKVYSPSNLSIISNGPVSLLLSYSALSDSRTVAIAPTAANRNATPTIFLRPNLFNWIKQILNSNILKLRCNYLLSASEGVSYLSSISDYFKALWLIQLTKIGYSSLFILNCWKGFVLYFEFKELDHELEISCAW